MWDTISGWFGGGSGGRNDSGLEALINANDLANMQYGNDFSQYQTFSDLPAYYNQYYDQPASGGSSLLGGMKLSDIAGLGLGALGAFGNYQAYKSDRDLKKAQVAADQANRQLGAGDDFAKMHALAQIIQARQGINLDPSLAYAESVRRQMGLLPDDSTGFAGVDVGGPMKIGMSSEDRLRAINEATGMARGGLAAYAHGGGHPQGLLAGGSPGQADDVNASLSHGEYVFDADTVAALGDGNTEAGAAELDRMREAIRRHKRSAPASKIPPPSKGALAYLKGAK